MKQTRHNATATAAVATDPCKLHALESTRKSLSRKTNFTAPSPTYEMKYSISLIISHFHLRLFVVRSAVHISVCTAVFPLLFIFRWHRNSCQWIFSCLVCGISLPSCRIQPSIFNAQRIRSASSYSLASRFTETNISISHQRNAHLRFILMEKPVRFCFFLHFGWE